MGCIFEKNSECTYIDNSYAAENSFNKIHPPKKNPLTKNKRRGIFC